MKNVIFVILLLTSLFIGSTLPLQAQWIQTGPYNGKVNFSCFASNGKNLFAGAINSGFYLSTDNGKNWNETGLINAMIYALAIREANLFAVTYEYNGDTSFSIYRSTDNGVSWGKSSSGLADGRICALAVNETSIFAGTYNGVYSSSDNGTTWKQDGLSGIAVYSLAVNGTNIFAGTYTNDVFVSADNGKSWNQVTYFKKANGQLWVTSVFALVVSGSNLVAGTAGGIFTSMDNGESWNQNDSDLTDEQIRTLVVNGTNIFAGTDNGVYFSTDNGVTWKQSGLLVYTNAVTVSGSNIIAGTNSGVYVRPLSEMITAVTKNSQQIPSDFSLSQNHPNPFNPTTKISYSLSKSSNVTLKVFDMIGREVATLVDGFQNVGLYTATFDGSKTASGIYLYRLQTESFTETKKMVLVK